MTVTTCSLPSRSMVKSDLRPGLELSMISAKPSSVSTRFEFHPFDQVGFAEAGLGGGLLKASFLMRSPPRRPAPRSSPPAIPGWPARPPGGRRIPPELDHGVDPALDLVGGDGDAGELGILVVERDHPMSFPSEPMSGAPSSFD